MYGGLGGEDGGAGGEGGGTGGAGGAPGGVGLGGENGGYGGKGGGRKVHAPKSLPSATKEALAQQYPRPCEICCPVGPRQRASVYGEPGSGPRGHGLLETRPM